MTGYGHDYICEGTYTCGYQCTPAEGQPMGGAPGTGGAGGTAGAGPAVGIGGAPGGAAGAGGSAAASTDLSVFGSWIYTSSNGQAVVALTLNPDGTYQVLTIGYTSTVSADETVEEGTFVLQSGGKIAFTPTEHTCATPLTPSTDTYAVDGGALVLVVSGNAVWFARAPVPSTSGLTLVVGCGTPFAPAAMTGSEPVAGDPGSSPSLFGTWVVSNSTLSLELTLNQDLTYEFLLVVPTSTVTADEYIQHGTFAYAGTTIVFTPTEESCPTVPPPASYTFIFNDLNFTWVDSSGTSTTFTRMASTTDIGAAYTLVVGCSINNGPWMPEPITPATN
jgi:hypothetical protein